MKVIHFVAAIDRSLGGVSMYMQLLAKELGRLVDLTVVTCMTENPLHLENCRVVYLPLPLCAVFKFRRQWIKILEAERPDIVHINGIWMLQTWIAQREALRMDIKTLITPHGMLEPWILGRHRMKKKIALTLFQEQVLREAVALVATTESERTNIKRLGYNANVELVTIGINIGSVTLKTSWKPKCKILFMSRVNVKKGIELLLDAVSVLRRELNGYELVIAGEGDADYIEVLKDKVAAAGLDGMVRFVGGVYGYMKWKMLRDADVLVLPTFSENFGIVVAEALACGTPVITTKGAPWSDLDTWGCGWWIERSADSLVSALKSFSALSENELERMGRNGRRLVETKYSSRRMADEMFRLYGRLSER